jgi:hypothetical protein
MKHCDDVKPEEVTSRSRRAVRRSASAVAIRQHLDHPNRTLSITITSCLSPVDLFTVLQMRMI